MNKKNVIKTFDNGIVSLIKENEKIYFVPVGSNVRIVMDKPDFKVDGLHNLYFFDLKKKELKEIIEKLKL